MRPGVPGCSVCSDAAAVGLVESVHADGSAEVIVGGGRERVALDLVERSEVRPGARLLVHQGFALAVIDNRREEDA